MGSSVHWPGVKRGLLVALAMGAAVAGCGLAPPATPVPRPTATAPASPEKPTAVPPAGIQMIRHVVIIVQENHTFDGYFGTFPGALGFPIVGGGLGACLSDPVRADCVRPFHDPASVVSDPPHGAADYLKDINSGLMNGFIDQLRAAQTRRCATSAAACAALQTAPDVMGYRDARDIPNYWRYASEFVLQDQLFEPVASWTLPSHLFLLSGWSAQCSSPDPMSCRTEVANPEVTRPAGDPRGAPYAWTDITYLLSKAGVSWAYYVAEGAQPACLAAGAQCSAKPSPRFSAYVSPLPRFETVQDDGQLGNIKPVSQFYDAAGAGALPAVSWIVPDMSVSEHPPASISAGEGYVTGLINTIMQSPDWNDTAIFLIWDEGGGFYDHLPPPIVNGASLGTRVPGLVISPYAKRGYIDHQTLSFGAYLKFIEDDFLGGQRLDPATMARPDARPTVVEDLPQSGDLLADFDFTQPPRAPVLLPSSKAGN